MRLHHKCHNPACCNPRHLEILGESELVERAPKRFAFVNRHKTHCIRGHEFVGESFFVNQVGSRVCRICREKYEKAYYAERKLKRLSNNHPDS